MNLNELQKLMDDLARNKGPSHSNLESREEELRAAFDAHPEWTEQMRMRDEFDARLCSVMPQVEIPAGLKDRLLTALDEPQVPPETSAADRPHRLRRRALLTATVTAATLLFAASVWMVFQSLTPDLTVADVERKLPKLWDAPGDAGRDTDPDQTVLPTGGWNSSRLRFPHGWRTHEVSGESLAFRKLEFLSDRGRVHTGLLASLPLSSLEKQPASTYPFFSDPSYHTTSSGIELAVVSWTDPQRKRVYFLAVPTADHSLEALEEVLQIAPV